MIMRKLVGQGFALTVLAISAVGISCKPDAAALGAIPCTDDTQCPSGFHCGGGKCLGGEHGPIIAIIGKAMKPVEGDLVEGTKVSGVMEIGYTAADFDGLKEIKLYVNNVAVNPGDVVPPPGEFKINFDTRALGDGPALIRLVAKDVGDKKAERFRQILIDNTPPAFTEVTIKGETAGNDACNTPACKNIVKRDGTGNKTLILFTMSENCTLGTPCLAELKDGSQPSVTVNARAATYRSNTGRSYTYDITMSAADSASDLPRYVPVVIKATDGWENEGTYEGTIKVDPMSNIAGSLMTHIRRQRTLTGLQDFVYGEPGSVEPFAKVEVVNGAGTQVFNASPVFADSQGAWGRDPLGDPNIPIVTQGVASVSVRATDVAQNLSASVITLNQRVTLSYWTNVAPGPKRTGQTGANRSVAILARGVENNVVTAWPLDPVTAWRDAVSDAGTELDDNQYDQLASFNDSKELTITESTAADHGGGLAMDFRKQVTFPSARFGAAIAYDSDRDRLVMFGGIDGLDGNYNNKTWEFDGTSWSERTPSCARPPNTGPACAPEPRAHAAMAYDPLRRKVVLYGGVGHSGASSTFRFPDVWEWDGFRWNKIAASGDPLGRSHAAMTWDPDRKAVIMFGGRRQAGDVVGDLWAWGPASNGALSWSAVTTATLGNRPYREGSQLAYVKYGAENGKLVVFGGRDETAVIGDAWAFEGGAWTQVPGALSGPGLVPRWGASMGFDKESQRLVIFGGCSSLDGCTDFAGTPAEKTLLEWDGVTPDWDKPIAVHMPAGRAFAGPMVFDSKRKNVLMGPGVSADTFQAAMWRHSGMGRFLEAHLTHRAGAAMAYDPYRAETVLFGGDTGSAFDTGGSSDTWLWDGSEWEIVPAQGDGPRARGGASMTFLSSTGTLFMFGGCSAGIFPKCGTENPSDDTSTDPTASVDGEVLADLWEWNGATRKWINRTPEVLPASWPNGRTEASLGQDPLDRLILVGGRGRPQGLGLLRRVAGTGTCTFTRSGTTTVFADWVVQLVTTGAYQVSSDGGKTFGPVVSSTVYSVPNTGVTLTWSGTCAAGDVFNFSTDFFAGRASSSVWLYDADADSGVGAWSKTPFNNCPDNNSANWGAPCLRHDSQIAFDPIRRRTVVAGGFYVYCSAAAGCSSPNGFAPLGDVWEWDGLVWARRPALPATRYNHSMVYDTIRQKFVVSAGVAGSGESNVYAWNLGDSSWSNVGTMVSWDNETFSSLETRQLQGSTYDSGRNKIVMYGGNPRAGGQQWATLESSSGYSPKLYMFLDGSLDTGSRYFPICRNISHFEVRASMRGSGDQAGTTKDGALLYIFNFLSGTWDPLGFSGPNGYLVDALITTGAFAYLKDDGVLLLALPAYPALGRDASLTLDGVQIDIGWVRLPGVTPCQ